MWHMLTILFLTKKNPICLYEEICISWDRFATPPPLYTCLVHNELLQFNSSMTGWKTISVSVVIDEI